MPRFDISCQTTDETKPPIKVLEERSSQSDLHCVSETYIDMYAIFKNAKSARTRLMTSRFNASHIKVTYSATTHLFIGEKVVLHSDIPENPIVDNVSFLLNRMCDYSHLGNWRIFGSSEVDMNCLFG